MTECFLALLAETVRRAFSPTYVVDKVFYTDALMMVPGRFVRVRSVRSVSNL